jgi:ppGpp synthetase/RelA/SpoT-type nucleotidyltranferase
MLEGAMTVIGQFLAHYVREIDHFREAARLCADQCDTLLRGSGIRAITTFRAKRVDRLRQKLEKRSQEHDYQSVEDIYADVVDLAGVRLAVYFPGDRAEVARLIVENFEVAEQRTFPRTDKTRPHPRVFSGYGADHYRLRMRESTLAEGHKQYAATNIEVQVASVLMHAWAEVEHDLTYKPINGPVSPGEDAILDELNGLVLSGEIALKRLQDAIRERAKASDSKFANHYELAAFLLDAVSLRITKGEEPLMGRADVLLLFLQKAGMDSPEQVQPYLPEVDVGLSAPPIADQIVDEILFTKGDLHEAYAKARLEASSSSPYREPSPASIGQEAAVGRFMGAWIELERLLTDSKGRRRLAWQSSSSQELGLDEDTAATFRQLRKLRNEIVHGIEMPGPDYLEAATETVHSIAEKVRTNRERLG